MVASFENAALGTEVGYGPYIDVVLPTSPVPLAWAGASYLGQPLTPIVVSLDATGNAVHPFARQADGSPVTLTGPPGGTVMVLVLPFGSVTTGQPSIDVDIRLEISEDAAPETAIPVEVYPGFRYGANPLDDPGTDPMIRGASATGNVTPELVRFEKRLGAPEGDTPVGESFTHRYEIELLIAPGQTIDDVVITDILPNALVIRGGSLGVSVNGAVLGAPAGYTSQFNVVTQGTNGGAVPAPFPGSDTGPYSASNFVIELVNPVSAPADEPGRVLVAYDFYIPSIDANGAQAGAPGSGNQATNTGEYEARWNGNAAVPVGADLSGDDDVTLRITNPSTHHPPEANGTVRLQKWVGSVGSKYQSVVPGEVITYYLDFQVSDVSAFNDVSIVDVLDDGLEYVAGSMQLVAYTRHNLPTIAGAFDASNVGVATNADGTSTLTIDLSGQIADLGGPDELLGTCVVDGFGGIDTVCLAQANPSTQGQVTFQARVLNQYRVPNPVDATHVVQNDRLHNEATIDGEILNVDSGAATGFRDRDSGEATVAVDGLTTAKETAFINGAAPTSSTPQVSNGDEVTFRLQVDLAALAFKDLVVSDFLPLPVFAAPASMTFTGTCVGLPGVNEVCYAPGSTFQADVAAAPGGASYDVNARTVTTDAVANSFSIDFGSFAPTSGVAQPSTIELYVTLEVASTALADGLYITNLVQASDSDSPGVQYPDQNLVQLQYTRPVLNITNGVIDVTGNSGYDPSGNGHPGPVAGDEIVSGGSAEGERWYPPYDLDAEGLDARDVVTYLVIVENAGRGKDGAWDITLRENLPPGLSLADVVPGSLNAYLGTGAAYTLPGGAEAALFGAGGLFLPGNVLTRGLQEDGSATTDGSNILYLTYQVVLPTDSESGARYTTISEVVNYKAELNGAVDMTAPGLITDDAYVTVRAPAIAKSIVATSEGHTGDVGNITQVAIGEVVRYRLVVDVAEGRTVNAAITDALPAGLEYVAATGVRMVAVSAAANQVQLPDAAGAENPPSVTTTPTLLDAGNSLLLLAAMVTSTAPLTIDLGTVVNSAHSPGVEQLVLEFNALVLNTAANSGTVGLNTVPARLKNNTAGIAHRDGSDRTTIDSNQVQARVYEPRLSASKTLDAPDGVDAGNAIEYEVVLTNAATDSVTAFDVTLTDPIPTHVSYVSHSVDSSGATGVVDVGFSGGVVTVTADSIAPGGSITLTIRATLLGSLPSGAVVTNTASYTASSLPGANGTAPNGTGTNPPGLPGASNGERQYTGSGQVSFTAAVVGPQKSVVSTSQAHTLGSDVAIGEVVRYRVAVTVPEGVNNAFTIADTLDTGLSYTSVDPVTIAIVGASLTVEAGLAGAQSPAACDLDALPTPTVALGAGYIASAGQSLTFNLGNISNGTLDDQLSCVVVEYSVLVTAVATNVSGQSLENSVVASANGVAGPSASTEVTVVEPRLTITKDAEFAPGSAGDAGDTVSYTIWLEHAATAPVSNATAFELEVSDQVPTEIVNPTITNTATEGPGTAPAITSDIDPAGLFTASIAYLEVGQRVGFTITGQVAADVEPGTVIDNTVSLDEWTSLPGDDPNERTYGSVTDDAELTTLDLSLTKSVQRTSEEGSTTPDVVVGEVVRYRLTVDLPEGVSSDLVVADLLPVGLQPVAGAGVRMAVLAQAANATHVTFAPALGTVPVHATAAVPGVLTAGNSLLLSAPTATIAGQTVTVNLGAVSNTQSVAGAEQLILEFNAIVMAAADGTDLVNAATVSSGGTVRDDDSTTVTVRHPSLSISKTVLGADGVWSETTHPDFGLVNADIGEQVTYRVVVTNAATAAVAAQGLRVFDDLPFAELELLSVLITYPDGSTDTPAVAGTSVAVAYDTLAPGESLTIDYTVLILDTVDSGEIIPNTADYLAQSTVEPAENDYNETGSDSGTPADYDGSDDEEIVMAEPLIGLAKELTVAPTTTDDGVYTFQFTFVVGNLGVIGLDDVRVTDDLSATFPAASGVTVTDATVSSVTIGGAPVAGAANPAFNTVVGGTLDTDLLTPGVVSLDPGQVAVIVLDVEVALADEDSLGSYDNTAYANGNTPGGIPAPEAESSDGGDPEGPEGPTTVTFTEDADLELTKTFVTADLVSHQDGTYTVVYEISLENTGAVPLRQVQVEDDLLGVFGAGSDVISASVAVTSTPATIVANALYDGVTDTDVLVAASSMLAAGATQTVQMTAHVRPANTGVAYTNTAEGSGTSPLGQTPEDSDTATNTFTAAPEISLGTCVRSIVPTTVLGEFTVTLTVRVANTGDLQLADASTLLDLSDVFEDAAAYTFVSATASGGSLVAPSATYATAGDWQLLPAGTVLYTAEQAAANAALASFGQFDLVITVVPGNELQYTVEGAASGQAPIYAVAGTGMVTDTATDWCDYGQPPTDVPSIVDFDDEPSIGVSKAFIGLTAVVGQPGTFDVTFQFTVRNYGNAQLNNVQLIDDLGATFADGSSWSIIDIDAAAPLVAAPLATANSTYNLLAPTSILGSRGQANDNGTVTATVRVTPTDMSATYENTAVARGTSPDNQTVEDDSVDGFDPDEDGDEDPTNDDSPTPFTFETPVIGLAKGVPATFDFSGVLAGAGVQTNPYNVGDGDYLVAYEFTVRNYGDVALSDLVLTDDLAGQLAVGNPVAFTAVDGSLSGNPAYDGAAATNVLAPGQTLGYSDQTQVTENVYVVVTLRPGAALASGSLDLDNFAAVEGTSPGSQVVTDDSNAGIDPDDGQPNGDDPANDGDDDPTNNDGPTTITITEDPAIGVAKAASVTPVGDGRYDVQFDFVITNYGDVELRNVQLTDDLDDAFGAGNYVILSLYSPTLTVNAVAPDPANAAAYDGSTHLNMLMGVDTLAVGASADVRLVVRVTPAHLGVHENQADADGTSPGGNTVTDRSTDGMDPDTDGDGVPDEEVPTPVDFGENPRIGLAKTAAVTMNDDGSFNVVLTFTVRNMGDVPLRGLQIVDPIDGIYAITDLTPERIFVESSTLTVNHNYDGRTDSNILMGNDTLAVGAERQVTVRLENVTPTTATSTTNTAVASGTSPNGTPVDDRSTDGFEPDPDDDGTPDEEVPTPIEFAVRPQIAIAKRGSVVVNDSGTFDVTFVLTVANVGNTSLHGVQVRDDLADYYANTDLTPDRVSISSTRFATSAAYDGANDARLLLGTDSMPVGDSGTITVVLTDITPNQGVTVLENTAVATGRSPDGTPTEDRSNDGNTPEPGVDVPTELELVTNPLLGVAKRAAVTQTSGGTYTVVFDFVLRNYGNTNLVNLSLEDDLTDFYNDAGLTAGGVSVASADLPVNTGFDGQTDLELLAAGASLAVGQSANVTLTLTGLTVTQRTSFTNVAGGSGETPTGVPTPPDGSNDGDDPDPDDNGDPTDNEVPTPVELVADPLVGLAKRAHVEVNPDGSYRIEFTFVIRNMGNTHLQELSLVDDLAEFYTHTDLVPGSVSVSSPDLPVNAAYDGDTVLEMLGAGAELAIGDSATVLLVLDPVNPLTQTRFENSATVEGESPDGTPTSDDSQDGYEPDPDDNGDPTDNDVPTPVVLEPTPRIGIAKRAVTAAHTDGTFDVTFEFVVRNYGNTVLENVQVRDDLSVFYALTDLTPAQVTVTSADFVTNPGYDGLGDPRLLAPGNTLGLGASGTVSVTMAGFRINGPVDTYNTGVATGDAPGGIPAPPDNSNDGDDPDPDDNGDPTDNDVPTPVRLGQSPRIGLAKEAANTRNADGTYDVVFTLLVRNYGDAPLANLSITDSLAPFYADTDLTPERVSTSSSDLTLNPAFNGRGQTELLGAGNTLGIGQSATLTITLSRVLPNEGVTRVDNLALARGTAPDGTEVADTSTDGPDPDPDGTGPSRHSRPTPVFFEELAAMLLTKDVDPGPYTYGDRVPYTVTVINPNDVAAAFDITDRLPAGTAYIAGTAAFDPAGLASTEGTEPRQNEPGTLTWHNVVLPAGGRLQVTYELRVLPGADDELVNVVSIAGATGFGAPISASASAVATIQHGVFELGKGALIGRVYFDVNRDDNFQQGVDVPIEGARVILSNGWQTLTDAQGNYAFRDLAVGTWTVLVDEITTPYRPSLHPEQLRDKRQHIVNVQGLTVSDFPFQLPEGLVGAERRTVVEFGPIVLNKRLLQLPDGVRVVLEIDYDMPDGPWPPVLITDPVVGGDAMTFVVAPSADRTVITYDLPLGAVLTDPEIEWSER